jgi:hypothetical protein
MSDDALLGTVNSVQHLLGGGIYPYGPPYKPPAPVTNPTPNMLAWRDFYEARRRGQARGGFAVTPASGRISTALGTPSIA